MIPTEIRRQVSISIDPLSEEAQKTIQWANDHFLRPDDDVHCVMVSVLDPEYTDQEGYFEIPPTDSFNELLRNEAASRELLFKRLLKPLTDDNKNTRVESHVLKSDASHACQTLIDYINQENMDCLIMGSRNLTGWKRFFMGSFSHHVQSNVKCPVLIVK